MPENVDPEDRPSADRLKAFVDAVVAIAMTLLVLPLMESVIDAKSENLTTAQWLGEHSAQLFSFALSFTIVFTFWRVHHWLYRDVGRYSPTLQWLNFVWMLLIAWLPVPTALAGSQNVDSLQIVLYVGTMALISATHGLMTLELIRHPELREPDDGSELRELRHGLASSFITASLFVVAMVVGVIIQQTANHAAYFAMLVLVLSAPLQRLITRRYRRDGTNTAIR